MLPLRVPQQLLRADPLQLRPAVLLQEQALRLRLVAAERPRKLLWKRRMESSRRSKS
jgi:hypothetical protein